MISSPHQKDFNKKYITSTEICDMFSITKPTLTNLRANDILPPPITLFHWRAQLWLRDEVMPSLTAHFKQKEKVKG